MLNYNDIIGTIGVGLILIAYFFNIFLFIEKDGKLYFAMNMLGAVLACYTSFLISYKPFIILEGTWAIVSLFGFLKVTRKELRLKTMKKYFIQKFPFVVPTTDGKIIEEHHGIATSNNPEISIAHMIAPPHWKEPFQTPEFEEYTYVISGKKQFIIDGETVILEAGQSIKIEKNTRVQYSNPFEESCEYIAVCRPAFDFTKVHREE